MPRGALPSPPTIIIIMYKYIFTQKGHSMEFIGANIFAILVMAIVAIVTEFSLLFE